MVDNVRDFDKIDLEKVVILITTYRDPPLFVDILKNLEKTAYPNMEIIVIDCLSTKIAEIIKKLKFKVPTYYFSLKEDKGAAHQLNIGLYLALQHGDAKYIGRIEDDAIPLDPDWLTKLVQTMKEDPNIAIAMPIDLARNGRLGYGGLLYGNCTFYSINQPPTKNYPCMGTGGHCYLVRKEYIAEMFRCGVKPYCEFFNISSEDIDFNLKAWLRGYKIVCTTTTHVLHEGTTGPRRAKYRVYHMYKNRMCLLLLNFSIKHILINLWYRILHDMISALLHSEFILMLKAYFWVLSHFREILEERRLRMIYWKHIDDKELKRYVLVKFPMPVKINAHKL
jgi:GT2 family glycosyltransferase